MLLAVSSWHHLTVDKDVINSNLQAGGGMFRACQRRRDLTDYPTGTGQWSDILLSVKRIMFPPTTQQINSYLLSG
jgi:hypothetical protein